MNEDVWTEEVWLNSTDREDLYAVLSVYGIKVGRRLRLAGLACCRLHLRAITDAQTKSTIQTAELFCEGQVSASELEKAREASERNWSKLHRSKPSNPTITSSAISLAAAATYVSSPGLDLNDLSNTAGALTEGFPKKLGPQS